MLGKIKRRVSSQGLLVSWKPTLFMRRKSESEMQQLWGKGYGNDPTQSWGKSVAWGVREEELVFLSWSGRGLSTTKVSSTISGDGQWY